MRPRLKIILSAFVAALIAAVFAMPILRGHACARSGGDWDQSTLTCTPPATATAQ